MNTTTTAHQIAHDYLNKAQGNIDCIWNTLRASEEWTAGEVWQHINTLTRTMNMLQNCLNPE